MNFDFREITIEDKDLISSYYDKYQSMACTNCFANNYLWFDLKNAKICFVNNVYLVKFANDEFLEYSFPIGDIDNVKNVIDELIYISKSKGKKLKFSYVLNKHMEFLDKYYKDRFEVINQRGRADYIYLKSNLANLSGKKLHKKRNHYNKFVSLYKDYLVENISASNLDECRLMLEEWSKYVIKDDDKLEEVGIVRKALDNFNLLDLEGILIRVDNKVIAFAIGEQISSDTFCIHFEKALTEFEGSYSVINREFVRNIEDEEIVYINREEDLDSSGLRQAKESYYPEFMITKDEVVF